jgi:hypothetical protein
VLRQVDSATRRAALAARAPRRCGLTSAAGRVALGAAASAALLAGCASGSKPIAPPVATVRGGPATAIIPYVASRNARSDVTVDGPCERSSGAWSLAGTVTNSAKVARGYQVVIDFVTKRGGTVQDTRVVDVPAVGPSITVDWIASGAQGHAAIACIVRQAQFLQP